jgi:nucleoid-associated protein YgaU
VVTRRSKLLAAGAVLAAGVALAWPLRRDESLPSSRRGVATTSAPVAIAAKPETATHAAAMLVIGSELQGPAPLARPDRDPFASATPLTAETAASQPPVFSTISSGAVASPPPPATTPEPPKQRIHVVHEGDSLDRLARRYLGDETRALEIFDLNREVLDNPHVLRLGTELRIPAASEAAAD